MAATPCNMEMHMSVRDIENATQVFARTVDTALKSLEAQLKEAGPETAQDHLDRKGPHPRHAHIDEAAAAIFAAEDAYSRICVKAIGDGIHDSGASVYSRNTGDAILRFAACGFRGIVVYSFHRNVQMERLFAIANDANKVGCRCRI
jgi:hypothetical protein